MVDGSPMDNLARKATNAKMDWVVTKTNVIIKNVDHATEEVAAI